MDKLKKKKCIKIVFLIRVFEPTQSTKWVKLDQPGFIKKIKFISWHFILKKFKFSEIMINKLNSEFYIVKNLRGNYQTHIFQPSRT